MNQNLAQHLSLVAVVSFALVYLGTDLVRRLALGTGFCSKPSPDRWNARSVAMGGGLAVHSIFLAVLWLSQPEVFSILCPAILALMVFGLLDDLLGFMPWTKIGFQSVVGYYLVSRGFSFPVGPEWLTVPAAVIWIVFFMNALNLNDNMDGLCGGIVTLASIAFSVSFLSQDKTIFGTVSLGLACASLGFLIHNFLPARIFMGDAGSLPSGAYLAVFSLLHIIDAAAGDRLGAALQCGLILIVPLFDVSFVISRRFVHGRNLLTGNTDHVSHRLVKAGLSEGAAVSALHLLGFLGAAAGILIPAQSLLGLGLAYGVVGLACFKLSRLLIESEKIGRVLQLEKFQETCARLSDAITKLRDVTLPDRKRFSEPSPSK